MELLFTIPNFWPHVWRGSERIVHDLSAVLAGRGHRVTVVTTTPGRPRRVAMDGFQVEYWPDLGRGFTRLGFDPVEGFLPPATVAGLLHRATVAHAFHPVDGLGLQVSSRLRRRPYLVSIQGWPDREWLERTYPRTVRRLLRALHGADRVTVLSRDSAERMRESFGIDAVVLYPGVVVEDFALPRPTAEHRTIVCTAAVDDWRKHVDVLIRAFAEVARDDQGLRLLLVGPGDPSGIENVIAGLDKVIAARVEYRPPPLSASEVPSLLAESTVGALTSEREAFGMVVLEYLASGMPAVGTDDAALPEIITNDTGALFKNGDVHGCAEALRRALDLAADPRTEGRCRARAREFDWSRMVVPHERLYEELARGHHR